MKISVKNSQHQGCRFCPSGASVYRVENTEGVFYICQAHKDEIYDDVPIDLTPEPEPSQ